MVGQCVTACTVGYYAGVSACLSCVSLCLTCDNFTSCVLCKAGKVQEGGVCVT